MDSDQELDPADAADDERLTVQNRFSIDLEICSVFFFFFSSLALCIRRSTLCSSGWWQEQEDEEAQALACYRRPIHVTNEQDDSLSIRVLTIKAITGSTNDERREGKRWRHMQLSRSTLQRVTCPINSYRPHHHSHPQVPPCGPCRRAFIDHK